MAQSNGLKFLTEEFEVRAMWSSLCKVFRKADLRSTHASKFRTLSVTGRNKRRAYGRE